MKVVVEDLSEEMGRIERKMKDEKVAFNDAGDHAGGTVDVRYR